MAADLCRGGMWIQFNSRGWESWNRLSPCKYQRKRALPWSIQETLRKFTVLRGPLPWAGRLTQLFQVKGFNQPPWFHTVSILALSICHLERLLVFDRASLHLCLPLIMFSAQTCSAQPCPSRWAKSFSQFF